MGNAIAPNILRGDKIEPLKASEEIMDCILLNFKKYSKNCRYF